MAVNAFIAIVVETLIVHRLFASFLALTAELAAESQILSKK